MTYGKTQSEEYVTDVMNFHRDAIQTLLPVTRSTEGDKSNGWIVWTGSSDRTINVIFVPEEYAEELRQKGRQETALEEKKKEILIQGRQETSSGKANIDSNNNNCATSTPIHSPLSASQNSSGRKVLPRVCTLIN